MIANSNDVSKIYDIATNVVLRSERDSVLCKQPRVGVFKSCGPWVAHVCYKLYITILLST
jgi:hypothetical protein